MPKLVFPLAGNREELVSIPITLPMGWKNSLPIVCTSIYIVADLSNPSLQCNHPSGPQKLDDRAESLVTAD